jgi:putative transcriptional regulator
MSIKINLDQVLEDRHMQSVDLAKAIGITKANLSILKTGKAKAIRFSTLERICEVLNCQPSDLLSFEPKD